MIEGELVRLRTVSHSDLRDLYTVTHDYRDPGAYMPISLTSEVDYRREFDKTGFWQNYCGILIIENKNKELVGEVGLFKCARYLDGRELYYRVFSGYRGKGYAFDALSLLISYFFKSSSMNRLQAVTIKGNEVSEHILEKCGFKFEGTMRGARYFNGNIVDLNLYSFLRSDFSRLL